ncbi:pseudaminic acid cytidylyltransferase, partial [Flavobacteriaceae bacterium]|nr:pseudaminic acid cytidylyltransferase [Flavobacteriaceae bacterium]
MSKICIIPARGGSKRIPRKNIKFFLGKPIIAYSIKAALDSKLFDEVMVSTDDKEIAEISRSYGAKTPFVRSKENANDFASTVDVLIEVLDWYSKSGKNFDYCCCLYPAAPLASSELLIQNYNILLKEKCNVVFPIVAYSHPIQRAFKLKKNNRISLFFNLSESSRTQDLEVSYHDSGQFYWFETKNFLKNKNLFSENAIGVE